MWTANAVGPDAATQAVAGAAGSDGGRAVEPRATEGFGTGTIGCQLTRCGSGIWPLACQSVALTQPLVPVCLPVARSDQAAEARMRAGAARSSTTGDGESESGAGVELSRGKGWSNPQMSEARALRSTRIDGAAARPIILKSLQDSQVYRRALPSKQVRFYKWA